MRVLHLVEVEDEVEEVFLDSDELSVAHEGSLLFGIFFLNLCSVQNFQKLRCFSTHSKNNI